MKTKITAILSFFASTVLLSQNITNTLGTSGIFSIKNGSNTYLSLSQSTGNLILSRGLVLPSSSSSGNGVIYLNSSLFLHSYGTNNIFVGENSGNLTMAGNFNSALGYNTLSSNTSGQYNTAVGYTSLFSNTTGYGNTCLGSESMNSNTTGDQNTALGFASMNSNTTGRLNTAIGAFSLNSNISGAENIAIGNSSLFNCTGSLNTALGYSTGSNLTTGSNNTLIGENAEPTSGAVSNQITLGNNQVTSLRCNVTTITSLSDMRDKKNITDLSLGLDFLAKLKPRQFNWDKREWYDDNVSDGSKMQETPTAGFIAQELDEVQTTENAEWLNLVLKDNPDKWEATPGNLFPVLVKAVQELKEENERLNERLTKLEKIMLEQNNQVVTENK